MRYIHSCISPSFLFILFFLFPMLSEAQEKGERDCVPVKISVQRLPDMNVPRAGHSVISVNDEIVVFGGHTKGFVPTPTAEYFSDGKWNLMNMVYDHDDGIITLLKSGKVLVAGGHEKPLGIGQTFPAELYDPNNHSFEGFNCLDRKRALASAVEFDNGKIIISGNWYHPDEIEMFDGKSKFSFLKETAQHRATPYILRTDSDDAVIFSPTDTCGSWLDSIIIDRVKGQPFVEPLFDKWRPILANMFINSEDFFIGDESKGDYSYIIPVIDSSGNVAFMRTSGTDFSLIPTAKRVPKRLEGDSIYYNNFIIDKKLKKAYLLGSTLKYNKLLICLEYAGIEKGKKAPLTCYYTDPLPDMALHSSQICLFEGNVMITGGIDDSNFYPNASSMLLVVNGNTYAANAKWNIWTIVLALIALALCVLIIMWAYRRYFRKSSGKEDNLYENNNDIQLSEADALFQKICNVMEENQLFLKPDIKLADIASLLTTNGRYVSASIKQNVNLSFSQFVNRYRVEYAKSILQKHPDTKLSVLCHEVGFSNEVSFFRSFKTHTNMTPKEWIDKFIKHE